MLSPTTPLKIVLENRRVGVLKIGQISLRSLEGESQNVRI